MTVQLLFADRDFDPETAPPSESQDVAKDLELDILIAAMAKGDEEVAAASRGALLAPLADKNAVQYRQDVVAESLTHPELVRQLYELAGEAIQKEREFYFSIFNRHPTTILHTRNEVLVMFIGMLGRLRAFADAHGNEFLAAGYERFFARLREELPDSYLQELRALAGVLRLSSGLQLNARLGADLKGGYLPTRPELPKQPFWKRLFRKHRTLTYTLADRDEAGARALSDLQDLGLNSMADTLARATDHILGFFVQLRKEFAFLVGCVQLAERLAAAGCAWCLPELLDPRSPSWNFRGLKDPCLALTTSTPVTANDLDAEGAVLVVTGANQGGKSTYLRSLGLAQVMAQSGLFVAARSWKGPMAGRVLTHGRREEDVSMKAGRLEEELQRLNRVVDSVRPRSLLLMNESFSSTNEREGSELARQIIGALADRGHRIVFVTHLTDFARSWHEAKKPGVSFLLAERTDHGRTFRILPGAPLDSSFGRDLYEKVFAEPGSVVSQ